MVGVTGFEPATSPSRTVRATKLRYTPTSTVIIHLEALLCQLAPARRVRAA